MRLIFMGTPIFALPSLDLLIKEGFGPIAVVTQPDRPRGRGKNISYPPVKEWALKHTVTVLQPARIKDEAFLRSIEELNPQLIVTAAYGRLLPGELLQLPPLGCINVHASLLPAYRGAAPIHRAIMDGAAETGVSIMRMVPEMDAGDIILQQSEPVYIHDTAGSLHDRLADKGAQLLVQALEALAGGTAVFRPQDHRKVCYAPPLQPDEEKIDWRRGALELHNQIRGMNPWPGAYTSFNEKRLKVWRTEQVFTSVSAGAVPGSVLEIRDAAVLVSTGEGVLALLEVQPQGKRSMPAGAFCRGCHIKPGSVLG